MTLEEEMQILKDKYLRGEIKWSEYYPKAQKLETAIKAERLRTVPTP